ncbi:RRXRR domain-containing protein [Desulfobacter latus]|uniref:RRXRR domain-containing protein n=1 Tax=Desulfobacter latus TaxID=2292 RepID=A0A850SW76_9BACT|nr:RRXRR domain-containing protein [Desulfobacter latus]NWH05584.1 RRXRR domain-containing protein [Desulfobacter latus]
MSVFVLDTNKKPQNPVHPAKARLLLTEGKAAVFRQFPFTIILKETVLDSDKIQPDDQGTLQNALA